MRGRREVITIIMWIWICTAFVHSAFAYPTVYPTGVTIYKPDKCWNSYTLCPNWGFPVLLFDMNGNVVHRWDVSTERARLLPNGHLLIFGWGRGFRVEEEAKTAKMRENEQINNYNHKVLEYDWEGNLIWEYTAPGETHHDVRRLPNGNTIFIYKEIVPDKYMKLVKDPERKSIKLAGDCICEVNPKGKVVWEWHAYKHLDLNTYCRDDKLNDWTHTNTIQVLPENHWYNEGHKEFKPGNVLVNPRQLNTCMIIDRETKEVVWKYSGDYESGLAHPHEPHMIEPGLPGAGNILIFDNGIGARNSGHDGRSFILEINPVTKGIVWKYENRWSKFFSSIMSSQQRLPNGNTFIDEATTARLFEVTPEGEIVWEYIRPSFPCETTTFISNNCRPNRYSYDYCPQLKALHKPKELAVTPPKNGDWHLVPNALR